ncbi:hypothetical protein [Haloferax volcanii]|uniref:hypothetical protein n=1 Tax=Haloferax volcanii TaxID=2246 RepID=UPI00249A4597|nr:hypothetical protein [Haloferax alexandrinus]
MFDLIVADVVLTDGRERGDELVVVASDPDVLSAVETGRLVDDALFELLLLVSDSSPALRFGTGDVTGVDEAVSNHRRVLALASLVLLLGLADVALVACGRLAVTDRVTVTVARRATAGAPRR